MNRSTSRLLAVAAMAVVVAPRLADAQSVLRLSDVSSDQTAAADLSGTLEFIVSGSMLSLTASNATPPGAGFDLDAIYFNALSNVTNLSLAPGQTGWMLTPGVSADGFGTFDYALINDVGNDPNEISPQDSLTFDFDILGTGPFLDTDFTSRFSTAPPGDTPALAAAKFINGPGDDSAYGAVIPEPGTGLLTLVGLAILTRAKRRR